MPIPYKRKHKRRKRKSATHNFAPGSDYCQGFDVRLIAALAGISSNTLKLLTTADDNYIHNFDLEKVAFYQSETINLADFLLMAQLRVDRYRWGSRFDYVVEQFRAIVERLQRNGYTVYLTRDRGVPHAYINLVDIPALFDLHDLSAWWNVCPLRGARLAGLVSIEKVVKAISHPNLGSQEILALEIGALSLEAIAEHAPTLSLCYGEEVFRAYIAWLKQKP